MHDIGKIGIADAILKKPGKLTPDEFELMTPVGLSITCFRYVPADLSASGARGGEPDRDAYLDLLNNRLMTEIQLDGRVYCSNAVLGDRFCLRSCIVNYRTEAEDMDALLDVASELGAKLDAARAAELLVFTRWVLVMNAFERALYADPESDLDTIWWELVSRHQGITPPDGRRAPDWAAKIHIAVAPVYYHNYLLGEMMASQLQAHVLDEAGHTLERLDRVLLVVNDEFELIIIAIDKLLHDVIIEPMLIVHGREPAVLLLPRRRIRQFRTHRH
jgi:hypothetical protein